MVQKLVFWFLFLPSFVWATGTQLPRGLKTCLVKLSSSSDAELVQSFDQALSVKGLKENEEAKLLLLETLLENPKFHQALLTSETEEAKRFRAFINQGASQYFYQSVIALLEKRSPPHALSYILLVKQNILPAYMPSPSHMPPMALQEHPKRTRLLVAALEFLFERNVHLRPLHFTRRIFAYIAKYPELSQSEKYNLVTNLILEFRHQVDAHNKLVSQGKVKNKKAPSITLYSYFPSPEIAKDGTRFICGSSNCGYYFAIMSNGRFFIVHRDHASVKFDPNTWDQHIRVREARAPDA